MRRTAALAAIAACTLAFRSLAADYFEIVECPNTSPGIRPPRDFEGVRDTTWSVAGAGCLTIQGPLGQGGVLARHTKLMEAIGYSNGPNGVAEFGGGDDLDLGPVAVTWSISDTARDAHSGSFALTDSPLGLYPPNTRTAARRVGALDLSGATAVELSFWHHWGLRYNSFVDSALVEVRANGGPWTRRGTFLYSGGFVGSFLPGTVDLSPYAGQSIEIRFVLVTSAVSADDGWVIDDVLVRADGEVLAHDDFESGTSGWALEGQWGLTFPLTTYVTADRSEHVVTFPMSRDRFGTPCATIDASGLLETTPVGLPTFVNEGTGFVWVVARAGSLRAGRMVRVAAPSFVAE